jgi:pimeloyl-ACP methyl ester carboxylesterase
MVQDFQASGLIELAAERYRVIAFDRPGFGHSERPRSTIWTPEAQADLLHGALLKIGVSRAIVLGHSWGASVAIALALQYPEVVSGLVLVSGYYYPSARADVVAMSIPAVPVLGDVLSYTFAPVLGRLMWPLVTRKMFGPEPTPRKFDGFPREMALRPAQIRASAAESALMIPDAFAWRQRYPALKMPVSIIAGEEDRIADIDDQSARLHEDVAQSKLTRIPRTGHMVHQTATRRLLREIDEVREATRNVVPLAA